MNNCCKNIPLKNKEVEVIQWGDNGERIVVEHYCIYNCKKCGNKVHMNLGEGFD